MFQAPCSDWYFALSLSLSQIGVFLSWVSLSQIGVSPSPIPPSACPPLFPPLSTTSHSFDLGLERGWDGCGGSCETKIGGGGWWLWSSGQLGPVVGRRVGLLLEWVMGWVYWLLIARFGMFWCSCWRSVCVCVWLIRKGKKILKNLSLCSLVFLLKIIPHLNSRVF